MVKKKEKEIEDYMKEAAKMSKELKEKHPDISLHARGGKAWVEEIQKVYCKDCKHSKCTGSNVKCYNSDIIMQIKSSATKAWGEPLEESVYVDIHDLNQDNHCAHFEAKEKEKKGEYCYNYSWGDIFLSGVLIGGLVVLIFALLLL